MTLADPQYAARKTLVAEGWHFVGCSAAGFPIYTRGDERVEVTPNGNILREESEAERNGAWTQPDGSIIVR